MRVVKSSNHFKVMVNKSIANKLITGENMAGRESNPDKLRAQAQELIKRAKKVEERRFKEIGQLVYDHYQKDFSDFDKEQFKVKVRNIFLSKKRERKN